MFKTPVQTLFASGPPIAATRCAGRSWADAFASKAPEALLDLVEAVMRDPFQGLGKPEALRYVLAGCWSRRVSQEHRLVYRVTDEAIDFLQARYHY